MIVFMLSDVIIQKSYDWTSSVVVILFVLSLGQSVQQIELSKLFFILEAGKGQVVRMNE
jgi:hypothetical protein